MGKSIASTHWLGDTFYLTYPALTFTTEIFDWRAHQSSFRIHSQPPQHHHQAHPGQPLTLSILLTRPARNSGVGLAASQRTETMDDPPPYTPSDAISAIICLAKYIDYREYPKLCLVSSTWRDIFQDLIWSQPDRFFATPNRSVNSMHHLPYILS